MTHHAARVLLPCTGTRRYNDHLHFGFLIDAFTNNGHTVLLYGPDADRRGLPLAAPYDPARLMGDIAKEAKADLFVSWGPYIPWQRWQTVTHIPRVAYEPDFHYASWPQDSPKATRRQLPPGMAPYAGADVLVVRSKSALEAAEAMPNRTLVNSVLWLPYSVSCTEASVAPRQPLVFFSGARHARWYPVRSQALDALGAANLLSEESVLNGYLDYSTYHARLQRHLFGLSCASKYKIDVAKRFEIAASGACLLTDSTPGLPDLFPTDCYLLYDPPTVAVQVAHLTASTAGREYAAALGERSRRHAMRFHTHAIRGQQLCAALKESGVL